MSPAIDFDLTRELDVARGLALEAGAILLEVYATEFTVWQKPGGAGPVTDADARANELIVAALHREFPSDAVIAEESVTTVAAHGPRCWYVDPLDGTREFVDRNGMFAVQIGLAVGGEPALGVVYAPASGKLYSATAGGPCMLEREGGTVRLHVEEAPDRTEDVRLVVSRSHRSNRTEL